MDKVPSGKEIIYESSSEMSNINFALLTPKKQPVCPKSKGAERKHESGAGDDDFSSLSSSLPQTQKSIINALSADPSRAPGQRTGAKKAEFLKYLSINVMAHQQNIRRRSSVHFQPENQDEVKQ